MSLNRQIFWVVPDRFDIKPDKSTWVETSEALIDSGYDVSILTYGQNEYQTKNNKLKFIYASAFDKFSLFRFSLLFNILIWLLKNAQSNDIVIINQDALLIAPVLRLFRRRNILLDIRTVPVEINSLKRKLDRWLFWTFPMRFLRKFATGFSFITDVLRQATEEEFDTKFDDYVLWSSGVNTSIFQTKKSDTHTLDSDEFILFYHGTISEKRGIGHVIEAMVDLKKKFDGKIHFVIVGDGPDYEVLKKRSAQLELSDVVIFTGLIPYHDVPNAIAKADCCICPLPNRHEWNVSSPIKVFEYMASGKPMILTPILPHKEVGKDHDFVVWTAGDLPRDYAEAIEYAYHNRTKLAENGSLAQAVAKECYEWSIQGKKLADYLARTFP